MNIYLEHLSFELAEEDLLTSFSAFLEAVSPKVIK